jgi:hypothetical protein
MLIAIDIAVIMVLGLTPEDDCHPTATSVAIQGRLRIIEGERRQWLPVRSRTNRLQYGGRGRH